MSAPWWRRMLVSGLDALPLTRLNPLPLPDDHPDVEFDRDWCQLVRVRKALWWEAERGGVPEDGDELFDAEAYGLLNLNLSIAAADFDFTGDDIKAWKTAS